MIDPKLSETRAAVGRKGWEKAHESSGLCCEGCGKALAKINVRQRQVRREVGKQLDGPWQPHWILVTTVLCPNCADRFKRNHLDPLLWKRDDGIPMPDVPVPAANP